jgi:hypothetical protein
MNRHFETLALVVALDVAAALAGRGLSRTTGCCLQR